MKIEFSSLHWDNVDQRMLESHKKVMAHFELPVNYHNKNQHHGEWMTNLIKGSDSDVVVVIEPDCIPLSREAVVNYVRYAVRNNTFVGIAQVSNHILPKSHIYAAPAFYVMPVSVYRRLGQPSFLETRRSDVGEEVSYVAETMGIRYRALMPTCFEKESSEGVWNLGCVAHYGIGTVFDNSIYHLYQSRLAQNIDLFVERCQQVIDGTFDSSNFIPSTSFS
jgi:hypothetical protein